jgi:hypothetical protein
MIRMRTLTVLLLVLVHGASAQAAGECLSNVSIEHIGAAMGKDVRWQPVFAGGGLKAWRIYGVGKSRQLVTQGVTEGAQPTHICGVPAREIFRTSACCKVDASTTVEVTFRVKGAEKRVVLVR